MVKNFYNIGYDIEALAELFFTSIIVIYGLVSIWANNKTMPLELLWQFILLGSIAGAIHFALYNERFLTKVSIKIKVISHYFILGGIISIFIKYFDWVKIWGISFRIFFIIYTVYFMAITINFYFYKRITGERFNDKLIKYKEKL